MYFSSTVFSQILLTDLECCFPMAKTGGSHCNILPLKKKSLKYLYMAMVYGTT